MDQVPEWVHRFYGLYMTPYVPGSQASKARLDRGLPKVLKHLPRRGSKVLDLACGAGLYLFPLEKRGYRMTGLDIQESMIEGAKKEAKRIKSRAELLVGDARELKFKNGSFDAIVFLGAATGHFGMDEMSQVAREAFRVLKRGGVMVSEVNDHVGLLASGSYQRVLYEPSGEKDILSFHTAYDGDKGTFGRLFVNLDENQKFKGEFHIWAPWIFNHVMADARFELKGSEPGAFGSISRVCAHKKP